AACQSARVGADRVAATSTPTSHTASTTSAAAARRPRTSLMDEPLVRGAVGSVELRIAAERDGTEQVDRDGDCDQATRGSCQRSELDRQQQNQEHDVVEAETI